LSEDTVLPANQSVFCFNSLRVGSNRTLNLPPGTYYINGGDAIIQGDLNCTGCTIVLTNSSTANDATIGQLRVNADSKVNMTPPTTCTLGTDGCFRGISIYQDRRALDSSSNVNRINGNSGSQILGAVYFPRQEIEYNGTGTSGFICTRLVGRRVNFSGNSTITNKFGKDCGHLGLDPIMGGRRVRLIS
jgi:hypothetical protein